MNPKLDNLIRFHLERAVMVARRQHKAISTERDYCGWLKRYFRFLWDIPNASSLTSEQKAERFLSDLARVRDVSAATQNSAFAALCWFYKDVLHNPLREVDAIRATRPTQIRHAPSVEDTRRLLATVRDVGGYPTSLIVRMLYECGLRSGEPIALRRKDVRTEEGKLFIMGAKGRKDRVVHLPCSLIPELDRQMHAATAVWEMDCRNGVPIEIPHQLGRKYPEYRFSHEWSWVFPQHRPCKHPRTGEIVRYHMHEANTQRAVKQARRALGISVLPHELRHAYATHLLDRGVNIRALQSAMGHANIETTAGYCHAEALSVPSPLTTIVRLPMQYRMAA